MGGNQLSNFKGMQRCQVRVQGRAQMDAGGLLAGKAGAGGKILRRRIAIVFARCASCGGGGEGLTSNLVSCARCLRVDVCSGCTVQSYPAVRGAPSPAALSAAPCVKRHDVACNVQQRGWGRLS